MNSPVIIVRVIQKVIIHNGEEEHTLHNTVTVSSTWAAARYSQSPCSRSLRCYTTNSIPFPFFGSPPRPRPTLFHSLSPSTASPYTNVFFQGRILLETAQCRITFWQTRIKHFSLSFVSCATAVRWVRDLRRLMACRSALCGCVEKVEMSAVAVFRALNTILDVSLTTHTQLDKEIFLLSIRTEPISRQYCTMEERDFSV